MLDQSLAASIACFCHSMLQHCVPTEYSQNTVLVLAEYDRYSRGFHQLEILHVVLKCFDIQNEKFKITIGVLWCFKILYSCFVILSFIKGGTLLYAL